MRTRATTHWITRSLSAYSVLVQVPGTVHTGGTVLLCLCGGAGGARELCNVCTGSDERGGRAPRVCRLRSTSTYQLQYLVPVCMYLGTGPRKRYDIFIPSVLVRQDWCTCNPTMDVRRPPWTFPPISGERSLLGSTLPYVLSSARGSRYRYSNCKTCSPPKLIIAQPINSPPTDHRPTTIRFSPRFAKHFDHC